MDEIVNVPAVDDGTPVLRVGDTLREARVRLGFSIVDVAAKIRLTPRQIEALEAEEFKNLPEIPFVRGFVRSYAKLLQIDPVPLLAVLPIVNAVPERIEPVSVDVPFNIHHLSWSQNKKWLIASAVTLVMVVVFAVWHFSTPKVEKIEVVESAVIESPITLPAQAIAVSAVPDFPMDAPASPLPVEVTAASEVVAVLKPATVLVQAPVVEPVVASSTPVIDASSVKLRIVFDADSWAEIKDANGKILSSQLNKAGSELNLSGKAPYNLAIGHAQGVRVYRRGKLVDLKPSTHASSEVARLTLE